MEGLPLSDLTLPDRKDPSALSLGTHPCQLSLCFASDRFEISTSAMELDYRSIWFQLIQIFVQGTSKNQIRDD